LSVSTQNPSQHAGMEPVSQTLPQKPQLAASVQLSEHAPSQQESVSHAAPQAPQLSGS
jgi:hypothetical protein